MKTIAVLARKGGAGKTTCAIHIGVLAQASGKKVLFFDLDPQRSLATWWRSREADTPGLVETDAQHLPELLKAARNEDYDLAVIDTPPAISFDTARIAELANLVLIPLRPSVLDIYAVTDTAEVVGAAKIDGMLVLNACPPPTAKGEAPMTMDARKALARAPLPLCKTSLTQRIDYTRALNGGEAVNEFAPGSKAAQEMASLWHEIQRRLIHT